MTQLTIFLALLAYFLPAIMAKSRHHNNQNPIFLTNLFLGWTVLGWLVALIWSSSDNVKS